VLFSPQAEGAGGQVFGLPILVVQSSEGNPVKAGGSLEVISVSGAGQGVEEILPQMGMMDQVLGWCLSKLKD
jgi:hypothetical protein